MPRYSPDEVREQTRRALEMRDRGVSFKTIGAVLDIGTHAAKCRVKGDPYYRPAPVIDALPTPSKWTDGRKRFARILHRRRVGLQFIADEINQQFPGPPLTGFDVRAELYGGAA